MKRHNHLDKWQDPALAQKGFFASNLAGLSIPYRDPKKSVWTRTNGAKTLYIEEGYGPKITPTGRIVRDQDGEPIMVPQGIPYGIMPRYILLYLSRAIKDAQQVKGGYEIPLGNNLNGFLERVGLSRGGKTRQIVTRQAERLFRSKIGMLISDEEGRLIEDHAPERITKKINLWWHDDPDQQSFFQSTVVVREEFAEILRAALPLDLDVIKALGASPMAFDLYAWLAKRHYTHAGRSIVTWDQLHKQFGSDMALKHFKEKFRKAFLAVKELYPHCSKIIEDGVMLQNSRTAIRPVATSLVKQGKSEVLAEIKEQKRIRAAQKRIRQSLNRVK